MALDIANDVISGEVLDFEAGTPVEGVIEDIPWSAAGTYFDTFRPAEFLEKLDNSGVVPRELVSAINEENNTIGIPGLRCERAECFPELRP